MSIIILFGKRGHIRNLLINNYNSPKTIIIMNSFYNILENLPLKTKVFFIEKFKDIYHVLNRIKDKHFDTLIISLYGLITEIKSNPILYKRLMDRLFIKLYALKKAKNTTIIVIIPGDITSKYPIVKPPNFIPTIMKKC